MVLKRNWHIITFIILIMSSSVIIAQDTKQSDKVLQQLTDEQKEILKEQRQMIDKAKKTFKNSLSPKQQNILKNKKLSRSERFDLLKKSLSQKQRSSIKVNRQLLRDKKIRFKRSLSKKQTIRLRRMLNDRNAHDRRRLARRLRRLIRDNITD